MSEVEKLAIKLSWKVDLAKESLMKTSQNKQDSKNIVNENKTVTFNEDIQVATSNVQNHAGSDYGYTNAGADTYGYNPSDFAGDGDEKSCDACTFLNPM